MLAHLVKASLSEKRIRQALLVLAVAQLGLGLTLAIAPGAFFDAVADYGSRNDHFLRDISTLYLALGIALLIAVGRKSWRVPVLAFATLQYGFHAINHLIDIGDGDPGWIGPFNFVSLAVFTALFAYVLRADAADR